MGLFDRFIVLENLGGCPKIKGKKVKVKKGKQDGTINIDGVELQYTSLQWDEKGERSAGKAVAGAVVGGLLTGGVGLLVGAALGGRKKDVSTAVIGVRDGAIDYTLYLRCSKKEFQQLTEIL